MTPSSLVKTNSFSLQHTSSPSESKSYQFNLKTISQISPLLCFHGHIPCRNHHHFSVERLQLPLYGSPYFFSSPWRSFLCCSAKYLKKKKNLILPCSHFRLSVSSHWHNSLQIPHLGLQDPVWSGCCCLSCCLFLVFFARYLPSWPPHTHHVIPHLSLCLEYFSMALL